MRSGSQDLDSLPGPDSLNLRYLRERERVGVACKGLGLKSRQPLQSVRLVHLTKAHKEGIVDQSFHFLLESC